MQKHFSSTREPLKTQKTKFVMSLKTLLLRSRSVHSFIIILNNWCFSYNSIHWSIETPSLLQLEDNFVLYFLHFALGNGTLSNSNINRLNNTIEQSQDDLERAYQMCIESDWIVIQDHKWSLCNKNILVFNSKLWLGNIHKNLNYLRSYLLKQSGNQVQESRCLNTYNIRSKAAGAKEK